MEQTEKLTEFIPVDTKARMLELQIREHIKIEDNFIFAETTTAVLPFEEEGVVRVVVCFKDEVIYDKDYPDISCVDILQEFGLAFTTWRTRRVA